MKKVKILMVLDNTGRGGAQTYAMNVLRNIDRERFHIDFVVNRNPENGYGEEILSSGSQILYIPKFKVYNWSEYSNAWKNLLKEHKYDIVHGHVSSTAAIYLKLAKKNGCATIAHSHSAGYRGSWMQQQIKKAFTVKAKDYADYWFSCSDKAAVRLFGKEYKNNSCYMEIPNAIISKRYKFNKETRESIRAGIGLSDNTLLVGHVGSFSTPKNHSFLLEIFSSIKEKCSDSKFILVGEGPLKDEIRNKADKLGLSADIIYTGNVGNVNEYLMAMDAMVFPSLFEGFPVTMVETQAAGLYTVLSDTITKQVYLTDCLVPMPLECPPSEWADIVLKRMTLNRESYNEIVGRSDFNMDNCIKLLEETYNKMIQ